MAHIYIEHLYLFCALTHMNMWQKQCGYQYHACMKIKLISSYQEKSLSIFSKTQHTLVVQSFSCVWLFVTPWTAALQASLSFPLSRSFLTFISIESMMPSNHLIPSPSSPPSLNLSQHQRFFQWVSSSHQVANTLELQLQHQSFQWIFRFGFLLDWLVWCPCCPRDSQESSPAPQVYKFS